MKQIYTIHKHFIAIMFISLSLSACTQQISNTSSATETSQTNKELQDVLKSKHPFIYVQSNTLIIMNTDDLTTKPLHRLSAAELPTNISPDTFKLSPDKNHITWYTASAGFIDYEIKTNTKTIHIPPNDWFNTDPYSAFLPNKPATIIVLQDYGKTLTSIDLVTKKIDKQKIDNDFGPQFRLSPSGEMMAIIEGFDQSSSGAKYQIVDISSGETRLLNTKVEPGNRMLIEWDRSKEKVAVIEKQPELTIYDLLDQSAKSITQTYNLSSNIVEFSNIDNQHIIKTASNSWHIISADFSQEIKQYQSTDIFPGKNDPILYPVTDKLFYALDSIDTSESITIRLWLTSPNQPPVLLIPEYKKEASIKFPESNEDELIY